MERATALGPGGAPLTLLLFRVYGTRDKLDGALPKLTPFFQTDESAEAFFNSSHIQVYDIMNAPYYVDESTRAPPPAMPLPLPPPSAARRTPSLSLDGRGLGYDDVSVVAGARCGDALSAASLDSVTNWLRRQGRGGFFSRGVFPVMHRLNLTQEGGNFTTPALGVADRGATAQYLRTLITLPDNRWDDLLQSGYILDLKNLLDKESANAHVRIQTRVGGDGTLVDQQAKR